ncbi:MAG: dynamin family protein [Caldilineales bacterium]|nr:dynamin family protein [Planctomycetales bacterium]MCW5856698.1 dynamin family protein [Caldilineales bacterium]
MKTKSPKQLRADIERIRGKVQIVIDVLSRNTEERMWGLGDECNRTATELKKLLKDNIVPPEYRVAVAGRFKAGKSSFVNEMLGQKLAGEKTSRETAAVTTFKHGDEVRARVIFVPKAKWDALKDLYKVDQRDPDAHRVASWHKVGSGHATTAGTNISFDLDAIEKQFVAEESLVHEFALHSADPDGPKVFRKNLETFTSSTRPHHCLVEKIEITAPSPILEDGVMLIDTPGLDDTERFRVELTEQAVQDVDAILFLAKSETGYGQSDKDFLLSLLRKGSVKQFIYIATQVDQTYQQHVANANDNDDEPQSIAERIEYEKVRIQREIAETLDQLSENDQSPAMQRYREQLGDIEILFTSAFHHRDWVKKKPVEYPIYPNDPGGINTVKSILMDKLSTESRLANTARTIESGARTLLMQMLRLIESRRQAVRNIKDREVAEQKLGTFREQFRTACEEFSKLTEADATMHRSALASKKLLAEASEQIIALKAEAVLSMFERDDVGRHWRTRRSGYWGYMHQLQQKVANQIFPTVAEHLQVYNQEFSAFLERFRNHLDSLTTGGNTLAATLELGDDIHFDLKGRLETFLTASLEAAQAMVEKAESDIVGLLEDFVSEEVQERISEARKSVADVWGTGTTWRQSKEVREFYANVKTILREALTAHVRKQYLEYANYLDSEAVQMPERAIAEAEAELSRIQGNIRAAMEAAIHGQRELFDQASGEINDVIASAHQDIVETFGGDHFESKLPTPTPEPSVTQTEPERIETDIASEEPTLSHLEETIASATALVCRFELITGKTGWSYSKLFLPQLLNGARSGLLVEPYLLKSHQMKNLIDFLSAIQAATQLKMFWLVTGPVTGEKVSGTDARLNELAKDLFQQAGISLNWRREEGLHDRYVAFDNGVLFKMGRGLDIFQPAGGLALNNQELRKVRSCSIDVFKRP